MRQGQREDTQINVSVEERLGRHKERLYTDRTLKASPQGRVGDSYGE